MYVIGTAGHVDHGKSLLVQALTGIDPDRLREEKARGMTIDLGFAWLTLPSGKEVSIVDVPGHERFIKNMLAGASGIDLALLVIAADEGVMPQTREHLAIIDLLGIAHGVIAITKSDLVDRDMLDLVSAEALELIDGTAIAGAPIVACSATTGDGLDELCRVLDEQLDVTPARRDIGRPRLPVDRSFTIAGLGTVVTGTLIDGALEVGQEVEDREVLARLRHHAFVGGDDQQRQVDAAHAGEHILDKALVAGHVDDAHLTAAGQRQPGETEVDRHPPVLLLLEAVRVDARQGADQRRLPVVNVSRRTDYEHRMAIISSAGSPSAEAGAA